MRQLFLAAALACLLAACGPAAPPASEQDSAESAPAAVPPIDPGAPDPMANSARAGAVWADVANETVVEGGWTYSDYGDGVHAGADFTFAGENEAYVQLNCNRASGRMSWWIDAELTPDQPTGLGFLTPNGRYVFAAQSENSEWPAIVADVAADDPRLDDIVASESFALQYMGYTPRLPGGPALAQVVAFCRSVE